MDADARRTRAIAKLARFGDLADRWARLDHGPADNPLVAFARRREAHWREQVERCAADDVASGVRWGDQLVVIRIPFAISEREYGYVRAAIAVYRDHAVAVADAADRLRAALTHEPPEGAA